MQTKLFPDHTHLLVLWIIYVISVWFLLCFCAHRLFMSCGHLLGKG